MAEKLTEQLDRRPWLLVPLALGTGLLLGLVLVNVPLQGYDWMTKLAGNRATDAYFPPWASIVIWPLAVLPPRWGLSLLGGITLATVAWTVYYVGRHQRSAWLWLAIPLALLTPQTMIEVWTGNFASLSLLAIWALPWAAPVVLMRSTFIAFAVLTRRSWFLASLGFGVLSLLLWPGWPARLLESMASRNAHPAAAGWEHTGFLPVVVGLILFLFTDRRDIYQNMAVGALVYPFVMPYHHIVLLPAFGALSSSSLILAWLAAWLMVLPVGIGTGFMLYFFFPLLIWWFRSSSHAGSETWLDLGRATWQRVASR